MRWEPLDDDHWYMLLRCGNCSGLRDVVVANSNADRFSRALETRCAAVVRTLRDLERESMSVWVSTFVEALSRDLVDASDFTPSRPRRR